MTEKRTVSVKEAVEMAAVVFDMNSKTQAVLALGTAAGFFPVETVSEESLLDFGDEANTRARFLWEWRAFVHAAVLHGLMPHAPSVVEVEYLRTTGELLTHLGYAPAQTECFADTAFRAYSEAVIKKVPQDCPRIFFQRMFGHELREAPPQAVALISSTMAMLLAATLDTFEKYEYSIH